MPFRNVYIEIQGRSDSTGSERYNLRLGMRRTRAAARYLYMAGGVPLHRIRAISYGESRPIADNRTPEGRAQNRCTTLVVME